MVRLAIDGGDSTVANDESPDIATGFIHVLLNVIDVMIVIAQGLPVLEDGFSAIAVMDAREQSSPGAGYRLSARQDI